MTLTNMLCFVCFIKTWRENNYDRQSNQTLSTKSPTFMRTNHGVVSE